MVVGGQAVSYAVVFVVTIHCMAHQQHAATRAEGAAG